MKSKRCYCGRQLDLDKRTTLELHLSNGACDVYGCPGYINKLDNNSFYHPAPQRTYTRYSSRASSKPRKSDYNLTIFQYLFESLAKSSINGISNCTSSRSIIGKLIWLVVFCACVTGYLYQASHFYRLYKSKPSVVQIEVENDGEVDFPAVTICNTNRIRRSAYCKYFPEKCEKRVKPLRESQINDLLYTLLLNKTENVRKELGHTTTMFSSCNFIGTPSVQGEECKQIFEYFYDPDYGNCYTFSSKTKDDQTLQAREVDFWQEENDLTLIMDVEPEEFMEKKRSPGLIVVIHDEKNVPDIHTEGLLLMAGFSYTITVSKSTVLLLPLPFKTNCTDYLSLPWRTMHHRRLTSRLCTVGCSQHYQFQKCQFVTKNLSLFYDTLPYTKEVDTEENLKCAQEEESRTVNYCRTKCGLPCRDAVFTPTVATSRLSEKELPPELQDRESHYNMTIFDDIIHVRIFYATLEHKIYKHIPKYDTMELFSFLGGYSGVWLGFSLLTVYELLEILVSTILFFCRKKTRQRRHRRLLRSIITTKKHAKTAVKSFRHRKIYR